MVEGLYFRNLDQRRALEQVQRVLADQAAPKTEEYLPLKRFLLSEKLSDVTFECSDEITLPAHRIALAAASDYFDTYFDGPWREQHPDGKWVTEFTSDVVKVMLTFVYTGKISPLGDSGDVVLARGTMKLAHEWSFPQLFRIAEATCTLSLSLDTFPAMVTDAQLYDARVLKHKCTNFLKENLMQVVVAHPHLTGTLASEYPELWAELSHQLAPDAKRQRTEA